MNKLTFCLILMSLLASYSFKLTRNLLGDGGKRSVFRTSMARLAGRKTVRPQPKQRTLDLRKRQLDPNLVAESKFY